MNAREYRISEALIINMIRRYGLLVFFFILVVDAVVFELFLPCFVEKNKDLPVLTTMRREARKEIVAVTICTVAFACH